MKVAKNKSLNDQSCINEKMLLNYIHGKLNFEEQHTIEMHLLSCELCSDALDGLRLINSGDKATAIVTSLRHEINKKLMPVSKHLPLSFQWWQVAAILVILVLSVGTYLTINYFSKEHQTAVAYKQQDNPLQKENLQAPISDIKQKNEDKTYDNNQGDLSTKQSIVKEKDEVILAKKTENNISLSPAATVQTDIPINEKTASYDSKVSMDQKNDDTLKSTREEIAMTDEAVNLEKRNKESVNETRPANSNHQMKLPAPNQNSTIDLNFNRGLQYYNEKNYSKALFYFNQSVQDTRVSFYSGMCNFYLKNYKSTVTEMNKATVDVNSSFYEEALFYQAIAFIESQNKEKARESLNKIISINGAFKVKAQNLLINL